MNFFRGILAVIFSGYWKSFFIYFQHLIIVDFGKTFCLLFVDFIFLNLWLFKKKFFYFSLNFCRLNGLWSIHNLDFPCDDEGEILVQSLTLKKLQLVLRKRVHGQIGGLWHREVSVCVIRGRNRGARSGSPPRGFPILPGRQHGWGL